MKYGKPHLTVTRTLAGTEVWRCAYAKSSKAAHFFEFAETWEWALSKMEIRLKRLGLA
jgi:hypothetical protein